MDHGNMDHGGGDHDGDMGMNMNVPSVMPSLMINMQQPAGHEHLGMSGTSGDDDDFCYSPGTAMNMNGFVSVGMERKGETQCINLLWEEWTLDTPVKFGFACLGIFLLAICLQLTFKLRGDAVKKIAQAKMNFTEMILTKLYIASLYSVQVTLGYGLMLMAMTYNVEIFCMILTGLIIGFVAFLLDEPGGDPCICDGHGLNVTPTALVMDSNTEGCNIEKDIEVKLES